MKETKTPQTSSMKGSMMRLAARLALAGPWRSLAEKLTCAVGHKFPTNRIVLSFCRHFGGQLIQREGAQFERVAVFASGGKMHCGAEDKLGALSIMHYFLGTITNQDEDERPLVKLLGRAIREGDTFFDIGSNFGFYSFYVGPLCGQSGAVHLFEANPFLIKHLLRSANLNKSKANIIVNEVAVGRESNKTLKLYDPERIGCSSLYPLEWLNAGKSVSVPLTTIDDYIRVNRINRLDVIKIDIEGAELDAFKGMQGTLATCRPWLILCELLPSQIARVSASAGQADPGLRGANPLEIIEFLSSKGYATHYIKEDDGSIGDLIERKDIERACQNVINVCFVRVDLKESRPELFAVC